MNSKFTKNIAPFVQNEIQLSHVACSKKENDLAFNHLENAHVLGQESTYWHVKVHFLMFLWSIKNRKPKEFLGQIFRMFGALTKTAIGLVPIGNTGGSNISPFKKLPLRPEHRVAIFKAKGNA
jgi:hypothetical protein